MKIETVSVILDADDLRIMASALRIYHRDCIMSPADEQVIRRLVHLAERADDHQGRCYAEMIQSGETKPVAAA